MANKNKPDMKVVKDGSVESKLTKNYENQVGKTGSKEEQAALAKELVNDSPRKMSEIIKDKREALKKNEDLLRDLQTNEYDIPMSSPKLYKQLMKFLEKDAEWGHTTATGLVMLYSNLKENSKIVQSKDWDGIVKLRGTSITILWTMVDNSALRENHAKLSELDTEVNHPDVILDVAIDKYNEAEEELTDLMNEVDPVVETV